MSSLKEISEFVNSSIDDAITTGNYTIDFFQYLKDSKTNKTIAKEFISSSLGVAIKHQIEELDVYINRGSYYMFVKESYDWMGERKVARFRNFLNSIIEDAIRYAGTRKRRKSSSKSKDK